MNSPREFLAWLRYQPVAQNIILAITSVLTSLGVALAFIPGVQTSSSGSSQGLHNWILDGMAQTLAEDIYDPATATKDSFSVHPYIPVTEVCAKSDTIRFNTAGKQRIFEGGFAFGTGRDNAPAQQVAEGTIIADGRTVFNGPLSDVSISVNNAQTVTVKASKVVDGMPLCGNGRFHGLR